MEELCNLNLLMNRLVFQNDLVHGWGLDFEFWRCVEVIKRKLIINLIVSYDDCDFKFD